VRILVALVLLAAVADARPFIAYDEPPPEEHEPRDWRSDRAFAEWSSWIRLGYGVASESRDVAARTLTPTASHELRGDWDAGLGGDVTFPLPTSKVRMGPWLELRPDDIVGGVEVSIAGKSLDMFFYEGERALIVRAGGGLSHVTAAVAYGYRCPWKLWGPYRSDNRYMIGVRLVATGSRATNDPNDWNMSFGIEFEPVGSLRYLGGIRSWY
jgi:hypothetical protein